MSLDSQIPEVLQHADQALRRVGTNAESTAWDLLGAVNEDETSIAPLISLKAEAGIQGDHLERLLLWHAGQRALRRLSLRIAESVRIRLEQDLRQLHMLSSVEAGSYGFVRAAKLATLRRFPAGPMEWEVSGIPRSYFLHAKFPSNLRFLSFVLFRLRAVAPCFFLHVAPPPRNRAFSVPREVLRCYHRIIRSMELQPHIRGLLAHAWFHDPAAIRDNPQLEVLSRPYLDGGGLITLLKPAPPSSGVTVGSAKRRSDYEAGTIQYHYGFAVWPRAGALRWADAHPEYGDSP
jgi:hypothetical protein